MMRAVLALMLGILLTAAGGCGGASFTRFVPPPTQSATLTASPSTLSFGSVKVGATSAPQSITLTASGGSVTVSSVAVQSPFQIAALTVPITVSSNQSITLRVTFAPTGSGSVTAQSGLSIASNA